MTRARLATPPRFRPGIRVPVRRGSLPTPSRHGGIVGIVCLAPSDLHAPMNPDGDPGDAHRRPTMRPDNRVTENTTECMQHHSEHCTNNGPTGNNMRPGLEPQQKLRAHLVGPREVPRRSRARGQIPIKYGCILHDNAPGRAISRYYTRQWESTRRRADADACVPKGTAKTRPRRPRQPRVLGCRPTLRLFYGRPLARPCCALGLLQSRDRGDNLRRAR